MPVGIDTDEYFEQHMCIINRPSNPEMVVLTKEKETGKHTTLYNVPRVGYQATAMDEGMHNERNIYLSVMEC